MPGSLNAYVGLKSKFGRSTQISMLLEKTHGSLKHSFTREIYTRSRKSGGCIYNPVRASSQHLVVGAQNNNRIKRATPVFSFPSAISFLLKTGWNSNIYTASVQMQGSTDLPASRNKTSFLPSLEERAWAAKHLVFCPQQWHVRKQMCKLKMLATLNTCANWSSLDEIMGPFVHKIQLNRRIIFLTR